MGTRLKFASTRRMQEYKRIRGAHKSHTRGQATRVELADGSERPARPEGRESSKARSTQALKCFGMNRDRGRTKGARRKIRDLAKSLHDRNSVSVCFLRFLFPPDSC